jgi:hypothetical protein
MCRSLNGNQQKKMPIRESVFRSTSRVMRLCSLLTFIYILCIYLIPYNHRVVASYHFSMLQYRMAVLMINLPVIAVWFFAFWGYQKLKQYASAIENTEEGKHFDKLANGLAVLAWSLPVTVILNRLLSLLPHPANTIVANYVGLIIPFIAFVMIGSAARCIVGKMRVSLNSTSGQLMLVLFGLAGILYCYLTLKAFNLTSISTTDNHYHLPAWLMVISIIIPYLYAWLTGLLAAYEITIYAKNVKGVLYKKSLLNLVFGLIAIILSFVASQYLSSVWPNSSHVVFNLRLVIMVLFRIIGGAGFVLIAVGANRLKRIEEV